MSDWILYCGVGFASLASAAFWNYKLKVKSDAAIKAAPVFNVGLDLVDAVKKAPKKTLDYAVVCGECIGNELKLIKTPEKSDCVCMRTVIRQHSRVWEALTNSWKENTSTISDQTNCIPFSLNQDSYSVPVNDPLDADILDLPSKYTQFMPVAQSGLEVITNFIKGEDIKGIEIKQEYLLNRSDLTCIGKVQYVNSQVQLYPPENGLKYLITSSPLSTILKNSKRQSIIWKRIAVVMGSVAFSLFIFWLYRKLKKMYNSYLERRELEQFHSLSLDSLTDTNETVEGLCVVCLERPRNILILPCGHLSVCQQCGERLSVCPICRTDIQQMLPFYNP